jgi:hypothetical protein
MRLSQGSLPSVPRNNSYSTIKLNNNISGSDKNSINKDYYQKQELKLRNRGYSLSKIKAF